MYLTKIQEATNTSNITQPGLTKVKIKKDHCMKKIVSCVLLSIALSLGLNAQNKDIILSTQAQKEVDLITSELTELQENADFELAREIDKIEIQQKSDIEELTLKAKRKAEKDIASGTEKAHRKAEKAILKAKETFESKKLKAKLKSESLINNIKQREGGVL